MSSSSRSAAVASSTAGATRSGSPTSRSRRPTPAPASRACPSVPSSSRPNCRTEAASATGLPRYGLRHRSSPLPRLTSREKRERQHIFSILYPIRVHLSRLLRVRTRCSTATHSAEGPHRTFVSFFRLRSSYAERTRWQMRSTAECVAHTHLATDIVTQKAL